MKQTVFFIFAIFLFVQPIFSQNSPVIPETDRVRLAEALRLREKLAGKVWKDCPARRFRFFW